MELASGFFDTKIKEETIEEIRDLQAAARAVRSFSKNEEEVEALTEEMINCYLIDAIKAREDENGWTDLAPFGVYLLRYTPVNYRQYGHISLRRFIESRNIFEIKAMQKSPNAKAVDAAFVRLKPQNEIEQK